MEIRYSVLLMIFAGAFALLAMAAFGCREKTAMSGGGGAVCESGVCYPSAKASAKEEAVEAEPAEMNTAALVVLRRAGVEMHLLEARPGIKDLVPGARLMPVTTSDAEIASALPDRKALYVTYCGSAKCTASVKLAAKLKKLGYRNVIEFRQGWAGWTGYKSGKDLGEPEINAAALRALMSSGEHMHIFDARTGKYDDGRRVPGAGNLSPMAKKEQVVKVLHGRDDLVITYCTNLKCPASRMLAASLRKMGYRNVIEYPQGIEGWAAAGYPVQKVK
ncbi:MAG: rhodanese-like domain-containing protein [Planctomycetota bacterium]|jgi:rhodanese-related sulfurtransferase